MTTLFTFEVEPFGDSPTLAFGRLTETQQLFRFSYDRGVAEIYIYPRNFETRNVDSYRRHHMHLRPDVWAHDLPPMEQYRAYPPLDLGTGRSDGRARRSFVAGLIAQWIDDYTRRPTLEVCVSYVPHIGSRNPYMPLAVYVIPRNLPKGDMEHIRDAKLMCWAPAAYEVAGCSIVKPITEDLSGVLRSEPHTDADDRPFAKQVLHTVPLAELDRTKETVVAYFELRVKELPSAFRLDWAQEIKLLHPCKIWATWQVDDRLVPSNVSHLKAVALTEEEERQSSLFARVANTALEVARLRRAADPGAAPNTSRR